MLISLSVHRLPLLSPPISSRANSKLICNSQWWRNWCLILVLGNRIMWVIREWGKREAEKDGHFGMKNWLLCLDYFSTWKAGINHSQHALTLVLMPFFHNSCFGTISWECHCLKAWFNRKCLVCFILIITSLFWGCAVHLLFSQKHWCSLGCLRQEKIKLMTNKWWLM